MNAVNPSFKIDTSGNFDRAKADFKREVVKNIVNKHQEDLNKKNIYISAAKNNAIKDNNVDKKIQQLKSSIGEINDIMNAASIKDPVKQQQAINSLYIKYNYDKSENI